MDRNYYTQFKEVYQAYKCERDPETDSDGNIDETLTSLSMPETFGYVQRAVSRSTAQIPSLSFKSRTGIKDLIGHTLMSQWDRGGTQRWQKLHYMQTALFGWSVRAWHWAEETFKKKRRVDPMQPDSWREIKMTYGVDLAAMQDPEQVQYEIARLLEQHGSGSPQYGMYLPVTYDFTAFEGPKSDVIMIADCFPQPNFRSIQTSEYFIVARRRNLDWINRTKAYYAERQPSVAQALEELLKKYPTGTMPEWYSSHGGSETGGAVNFRRHQQDALRVEWDNFNYNSRANRTYEWTFYEEHRPGDRPRLAMCAEREFFIGEVDYPYDLDGKIAFTEAVLIDDLHAGIGDSVPRVLRGVQQLHDRLRCRQSDLVHALVRPTIGTDDRHLWENAKNYMTREGGLRLLYMPRGPNSLWTNNEGPAIAAAVAALNEEGAIARQWQVGSGETNISVGANVDPIQGRTATGARLMGAVGDLLTRNAVMMFIETSIKADAEMMYLLNRTEMTRDFEFDAMPYRRTKDLAEAMAIDPKRQEWVKVSPLDFQEDGDIVVEEGSTLAADDEGKMAKAATMWQMFSGRPDVNQEALLFDVLSAMGKGYNAASYIVKPPPPPPPPAPVRPNLSVSVKWEDLAQPIMTPAQQMVLQSAGITMQVTPPDAGMPPGAGMPPMGQGPGPEAMPPPEMNGMPPMGAFPPEAFGNPRLAALMAGGPPPGGLEGAARGEGVY